MLLTWDSIEDTVPWASLREPGERSYRGQSFEFEDFVVECGDAWRDWYLLRTLDGVEFARIGRGAAHGMVYISGAGSVELQNRVLEHNRILSRVVEHHGVPWIHNRSNHPIEPLDGRLYQPQNNMIVGSSFYQTLYPYSLYQHFVRAARAAEHVRVCMEIYPES